MALITLHVKLSTGDLEIIHNVKRWTVDPRRDRELTVETDTNEHIVFNSRHWVYFKSEGAKVSDI